MRLLGFGNFGQDLSSDSQIRGRKSTKFCLAKILQRHIYGSTTGKLFVKKCLLSRFQFDATINYPFRMIVQPFIQGPTFEVSLHKKNPKSRSPTTSWRKTSRNNMRKEVLPYHPIPYFVNVSIHDDIIGFLLIFETSIKSFEDWVSRFILWPPQHALMRISSVHSMKKQNGSRSTVTEYKR